MIKSTSNVELCFIHANYILVYIMKISTWRRTEGLSKKPRIGGGNEDGEIHESHG